MSKKSVFPQKRYERLIFRSQFIIMDIARAIEDESEPSITIFTHSLPEEAFKGKKATQYHELFFDHTSDPSLRDVAPFLNELEYMEFRKRTYIEGFANYYVYKVGGKSPSLFLNPLTFL